MAAKIISNFYWSFSSDLQDVVAMSKENKHLDHLEKNPCYSNLHAE